MSKNLEELRREYAENEAKLQQYRHRVQRLEQRKKYYEKGERHQLRPPQLPRNAGGDRERTGGRLPDERLLCDNRTKSERP